MMKTVKSLLLGTATVLVGAVAVQAADLAAPEPVEYVRICDAYGAGYFFIPGTDTCLKISGVVRAYYVAATNNFSGGTSIINELPGSIITPAFVNLQVVNQAGATVTVNSFNPTVGTAFTNFGQNAAVIPAGVTNVVLKGSSPVNDQFALGVRARLEFDARSRTEWGVLRSFFQFAARSNNLAQNGDNLQIRYGFVQFGVPGNGLVTAGVTDSFFNGVNLDGTYIGDNVGDRGDRLPVLAYTASFGNGISATISLENAGNTWSNDSQSANSSASLNIGGTSANSIYSANGSWVKRSIGLPDLVGNLTVAQAWGTAWVSGALSKASFISNPSVAGCSVSVTGICTSENWGYALQGGVQILLPAFAKGDNLVVKGTYADGAIEYLGNIPNSTGYWANANVNRVTGLACGVGAAACDGGVNNITGWAIAGSFVHFLTPAVSLGLTASYASISPSFNGAFNGNQLFLNSAFQVTGQVNWTPVKNLQLGVEIFYINNNYTAFVSNAAGAGLGNLSRSFKTSDNGWGGMFRIQRAF